VKDGKRCEEYLIKWTNGMDTTVYTLILGLKIIKVHLFSGHIHILIADKGVGFESGKAELIFQKFTSEGQSGTEGEISAGIGLYLTRKIIQSHGGMIAAFSEGKNKGAVFTIQLPIAS
jgi:signal transduction histidine kinase